MKIRFLADANLNHHIVAGITRRNPQIDFLKGVWADGTADLEVLVVAAGQGRVLVSHDVTTMQGHFAEFIFANESPGLLLLPQRTSAREAIERMIQFWEQIEQEQMRNRVWFLPRKKE